MILLLKGRHKDTSGGGGHFCENHRTPYPVHPKKQRQEQHRAQFKHKGPQKGYQGRYLPVAK